MSKELRPIGLSLQTLQRGPYDRARPALCVPPLRAGQQESSLLQRPPEKGPPVLRGHDGRRGHPATLKIKFRENENEKKPQNLVKPLLHAPYHHCRCIRLPHTYTSTTVGGRFDLIKKILEL